MQLLHFVIFAILSWFFFKIIINYLIFLRLFYYIIFLIFGYAILTGYLMFYFKLESFFTWHIILFIFIYYFGNYQDKQKTLYEEIENESTEESDKLIKINYKKTFKHYKIFFLTYIITFAISFLYFLNRQYI
jgi:hypothetical protein